MDVEQLLAERGIDSSMLMPRHRRHSNERVASPFLPLEFFDNEDYDCRTPEEWLALGSEDESRDQKSVPAKALLPDSDDQESSFPKYSWHLVGVLDYRKEKRQYLVQKVKQSSGRRDKDGNPGIDKREVNSLQGPCAWIPRIRLCFTAENPRVFAERIFFAVRLREEAEVRLLVETRTGDLEKQAILEYDCAMNKMIFNHVVKNNPEEFSHVTIPKKDAEYVPQKGIVLVPDYDYDENQDAFVSRFLLRMPAVISALSKICCECNEVANMRLFNVTYIKPLQLSQFESMQSHIHTALLMKNLPKDCLRDISDVKSVNLFEAEVTELREKVCKALVQAAIPLRAYAAKYEQYLELYNFDIDFLLKSCNGEQTSQEVKTEVERHLKEKETLENSLPSSIVIGPFFVNVDIVRQTLTRKRKAIASALLDNFALKLRQQMERVCDACNTIFRKLCEKPNSIEELAEKSDWMTQIPEQLKRYTECIGRILSEYEVIDDFNHRLSDEDVMTKYTAIKWPQRIISEMEAVATQHMEDRERFRKIQLSNQKKFEDQLNSLQVFTAGFARHADMDFAHKTTNKVMSTWKMLKECQDMAQTYNTRQRLLGLPVSNYDILQKLEKDLQPFKDLWTTTSNWLQWTPNLLNGPLFNIDPEWLEHHVTDGLQTMRKSIEHFEDIPDIKIMATEMCNKIEDFHLYVTLIQGLQKLGTKRYLWKMLSERIHMKIRVSANLNLSQCLELGLQNHMDDITYVAKTAAIEQALENMEQEMSAIVLKVLPYGETESSILKIPEEAFQLLDDHVVKTQSMASSPFNKTLEGRINSWERRLRMTQDVMEEWLMCQQSWLRLKPIFTCDEISQLLPSEGKIYQQTEQQWNSIMRSAVPSQKMIELSSDPDLEAKLKRCNESFEKLQKSLSVHLEKKRGSFSRLFFLSDAELLEILSQAQDPTAVQPHLHKCFENISQLEFQSDLKITHMYCEDGEQVELSQPVMLTGNLEDWLRDLERSMKATLKDNVDRSLSICPQQSCAEWVLSWPGQVVLASRQVFWTAEVSEALEKGNLANCLYPRLQTQLGDLVQLMRGDLSRMQRAVLSAIIVTEVHAQQVVAKLVEQGVSSISDFEWISQLRYYWTKEDLYVRALNAEFLYGYEYVGNPGRLVITPLTDRCYLTLTGALNLVLGGALAGPAGSGKTETIKDLGKALAINTIILSCSDQLDFIAMSKFFKGMACSGSWVCFDDISHVDVEVLSVMAQQISTVQKAQQQKVEHFVFEGVEIPLVASCAVFFTINPGYSSCTEIPDNLKVLFRPVAMMVPDHALIAEISLYSFGFSEARILSQKIATTFRLCSEHLSSQDHYDFGMRAVKTVISVAGTLKRENPNTNEKLICLWAIQNVTVPALLLDDLKLFSGIVTDIFPETTLESISYSTLEESLRSTCITKNLKDVDGFISKCVQLFETSVVRHSLMLVGPSGSGKTKCYELLGAAVTALEGQPAVRGGVHHTVEMHVVNPKSVTVGQLYGEYDSVTHEWTDGILRNLIRGRAAPLEKKKKWYILWPVDAVWTENMNSVLDDNKKLCLSSGETRKLTKMMTVMFEVEDLAFASPATVSRCGMVYMEATVLGLTSFTDCWLKQIPEALKPYTEQLNHLFSVFLRRSREETQITCVRASVKEVIILDSNLICSLLKLMDCFFWSHNYPASRKRDFLKELIEPWFFSSLVWSIGASGMADSRQRFSVWLREKMAEERIKLCFPDEGLVFDYKLDVTWFNENNKWVNWMKYTNSVVTCSGTNDADVVVPTVDTVRLSFLMDTLTNQKPVLCVGPGGSGKTLIMSDKLLRNMPSEYITHSLVFSAQTSANQTQDHIESKLSKRWKGVLGPPRGKRLIFFIDDVNMPMLETCGAQPPVELLRQWMDHGGWYNRKQTGTFNQLVEINFACAMATPGGGRNPVTQRFARHFNILSLTEIEDSCKRRIFSTLLGSWMGPVPEIQALNESLVNATLRVYSALTSRLLPTPTKSHYTFNLRDLSRVFQGILMAEASIITEKSQLLQLWYHESCRVFQDRMVCAEDRDWFHELLKDCIQEFDCCFEEVLPQHPILYGDFIIPEADPKVYTVLGNKEELVKVVEKYMEDFNHRSVTKLKLVLFMGAIEHVCRISRILRQPLGNALLLGADGSGRRSLAKLASYICRHDCFQIDTSETYSQTQWREDIKSIMLKAALHNQQITFLFAETQIKSELFLEDINNILSSGDVPNLYTTEEQEHILTTMRSAVQDPGLEPTDADLMTSYTRRVRSNIHTVLCMSPIGEMFRATLRQFPSLVNCCTMDWFSAWPEEALQAVATSFLNELPELEVSPMTMKGLALMCVKIHQTVTRKSEQYLAELSRHNYITSKSYIELLRIFSDLTGHKKQELRSACQRIETGLDKLQTQELRKEQEESETRSLVKERSMDADVPMETSEEAYRTAMAEEWLCCLKELNVPHSEEFNFLKTLGDPVNTPSWQNSSLSKDNLLLENCVIAQHSLRWPLFIDPWGQANTWIRKMEEVTELTIVKNSDQDLLYSIATAVCSGSPCLLENVREDFDPGLEPLLLQQAQLMTIKQAELDTDACRAAYMPVAVRARILFFCMADLSSVDPMCQYTLEWFLHIFRAALANSERADTAEKRMNNIIDYFTFSLYSSVSQNLFEKHKPVFAFLLCSRIMMNDNKIDETEWCFLLSGGRPVLQLSNPAANWLPERAWQGILGLHTLDNYRNLSESFTEHLPAFKRIFESKQPHREPFPGEWGVRLDSFQKLLVLRCLRPDCLIQGLQDLVSAQLGQRYVEPQTPDLSVVFMESSPTTPLLFILSPGADPAADLCKLADVMNFSSKMSSISLGQGQGPLAETMMRTAMQTGHWVFFQNCHLAPGWMSTLERLVESIDPVKVHKDFRLWLTSLPSNSFPVSIIQNSFKIAFEPPGGIKASLQKTYLRLSNDPSSSCCKAAASTSLLLSLCLFHGVVLGRRKFGSLGFNVPYLFTDEDLNICISQLKEFLDTNQDIPYKALIYTAGEIHYGGRVTDEWDRRCLLTVLQDFYCPDALSADHVYSSSGIYRQIHSNLDTEAHLAYVRGLPINDAPDIFGLHDNANIQFGENEAFTLLDAVVRLQPEAQSAGSKTLEEAVEEVVTGIVGKVPRPFGILEVTDKYPLHHEDCMNAVLIHELLRYNQLLVVISQSLSDVGKALRGLTVMSPQLELTARSLFLNMVPDLWKSKAYPSLKPLASWVSDLLQRIGFLQGWISHGLPPVFWISGVFSPQAFLTGTLQNYARRSGTSVDTVGFDFEVMAKSVSEISETPPTGCYIHGLFLEGARWDITAGGLTESRPGELYTEMSVIWLIPKPNRKPPASGVYLCPIYKTLRRAGTLSSTGRPTSHVGAVELPTDVSQNHWIKRGVALICALDR
ncbi:LOW QUALITY PROTEIN: dynein axonemal heavy chain 1 [Xenentodon cancila]